MTRSNEVGMVNVVLEMLSGTSLDGQAEPALAGLEGGAHQGCERRAVGGHAGRVEAVPCGSTRMPCSCTTRFTDLALALGLRDTFEFYLTEIPKVAGAEGAFATKNLPHFLESLLAVGAAAPAGDDPFQQGGLSHESRPCGLRTCGRRAPGQRAGDGLAGFGLSQARRGLLVSRRRPQHRWGGRGRVAAVAHRRDLRRHQEAHAPG